MSTQIYDITNKAGPYIAGIKLTPGQSEITLTAEQAAYELAQGTITATGEPGPPEQEPAPVVAGDRVELKRAGLATRPTAAELAAFVQQTAQRINPYAASLTLTAADKSALVVVSNAAARVVTLPNDWAPGDSVTVRRGGAGAVTWALEAGATMVLPAAKSAHTGISAQHEEVVFKVLSNAGEAAVWAASGATT
ncbi:hypothetical protein [Bosea sp. BK604]|uniref:hypothetical protein n=1 Tax=Bosea sp. BK604 TaxID=2512180 RepID=UPI001053DF49|nr:hypothetical protein [Bosea sp. BK604]TCR70537.1 hypothetical protein EV560_101944 [Bosea sp. BK604]